MGPSPIPLATLEAVLRDSTPLLAEIRLELGKGPGPILRQHARWQKQKLNTAMGHLGPPVEFSLPTAQQRLRCARSQCRRPALPSAAQ